MLEQRASAQARHYPRETEEPNRFTSAIESSLQQSPEDPEEG